MQLESNTAALELLSCDLTNKDEAISINRATMAVNKPGKTFNKEPVSESYKRLRFTNIDGRHMIRQCLMMQQIFLEDELNNGQK